MVQMIRMETATLAQKRPPPLMRGPAIIRWRPDMNRKSKNRKIKGYGSGYDSEFWHFSIESQVRFFSHGCTNFLGLHPWLKIELVIGFFFERSDWLIPCHKYVLVQHLPPRDAAEKCDAMRWTSHCKNINSHCKNIKSHCKTSIVIFGISMRWCGWHHLPAIDHYHAR
jgi:hypothetical protein